MMSLQLGIYNPKNIPKIEKVNQVVEDGKAENAQMHFSPRVEL